MPISPVDVFVTEEVFGSTFPATRKGYPGRTVGWWPFDNPGSGSSCTRSDELCTLPAELCEIPTSRVIGLSCPPRAEDSDTCPANLLKPFVRGNCRKHDFRVRRQALMIDQHDPVCYGQTWNYTLQNDACFVSSIATTLYDGSIPQANDDFTEGDGHHPTSFIEECHQYDPGSVCSASSKTCRPSTAPANNGIRQVMNENEYNMLTAKEAVMLQVQAYLTGNFTGYKKRKLRAPSADVGAAVEAFDGLQDLGVGDQRYHRFRQSVQLSRCVSERAEICLAENSGGLPGCRGDLPHGVG